MRKEIASDDESEEGVDDFLLFVDDLDVGNPDSELPEQLVILFVFLLELFIGLGQGRV